MDWFKRQGLLAEIIDDQHMAVVCSGDLQLRNGDAHFPFRVNSDFYYLTGIDEPNACLLIRRKQGLIERSLIILNPPLNRRIWDSYWVLTPQSEELSSYDNVFTWADQDQLNKFLTDCAALTVYHEGLSAHALTLFASLKTNSGPLRRFLSNMRLKKSNEEIKIIEQACQISSAVYKELYHVEKKYWTNEAIIEGFWINEGKKRGALNQAYQPIIAGGERACCLHYNKNNRSLSGDSYVLIDAGFEVEYYASDITRVLFLKQPTQLVSELYALLLTIQMQAIEDVAPGISFYQLQERVQRSMAEGLKYLGVFKGSIDKILEQDVPRCYMHGLGHHLGLDVHDASGLSLKTAMLEEDMVITVEPGFYFGPASFPDHPLRGTGFRIEDDVLVTAQGRRVLTSAPKQLRDILNGC